MPRKNWVPGGGGDTGVLTHAPFHDIRRRRGGGVWNGRTLFCPFFGVPRVVGSTEDPVGGGVEGDREAEEQVEDAGPPGR